MSGDNVLNFRPLPDPEPGDSLVQQAHAEGAALWAIEDPEERLQRILDAMEGRSSVERSELVCGLLRARRST